MPKPTTNTTASSTSAATTSSSCLLESLHLHLSHGRLSSAVSVLPLLSRVGIRPPLSTLSRLLSQCLHSSSLSLARRVHLFLHLTGLKNSYPSHPLISNQIITLHFHLGRHDSARQLFDRMPQKNIFTYNAMLAGYSRCGMLPAASRIFSSMPVSPDVVSYNTMIAAFARGGQCRFAVRFYCRLRQASLMPNHYTFSGLILACAGLEDRSLTMQAHGQVLVIGFGSNLVVLTSLVDSYAKCGCLEEARRVFDGVCDKDVQCWTVLIFGYAKHGDLEESRKLFEDMPEKNSVSWTTLIAGYARLGFHFEALDLFRKMVGAGVELNQFSFSSGLCACASLGSVNYGKQIHARMLRSHLNPNLIVVSSLVDMYSKCGDLEGGRRVFDNMNVSKKGSILWNTMISATGQHRQGREAIHLFEEMVSVGNKPDANTFVVLLTACSHSGLVAEGMQLFESMGKKHGVVLEEDHYVCLVELLCGAGHFEEVLDWLRKTPCQSSTRTWDALLRYCRGRKNLQFGKEVDEWLIELDGQSPVSYLLLSDIYAEVGNWESVEKIRRLMEEKRMRKENDASWIEIDNIVHSFWSVDKLSPSKEDILDILECLVSQMEDDCFIK